MNPLVKLTGHAWGDFLHYRAVALKWLIEERGNDFNEASVALSMDENQARMIYSYIQMYEENMKK